MNEHDRLRRLLQEALPPVPAEPRARDLWPELSARPPRRRGWTWLDLGAAAAAVILLSLFPGCLWLLLYHL